MQTGQIINEMLPSHAALSKGLMEMLLKLGVGGRSFGRMTGCKEIVLKAWRSAPQNGSQRKSKVTHRFPSLMSSTLSEHTPCLFFTLFISK